MSVQEALKFIQEIGKNPSLRRELESLRKPVTVEDIVKIGSQAGFQFTARDLQTAFSRDWTMRKYFYCGEPAG